MADVRQRGTFDDRGRYRTTRKYTLGGLEYSKTFIARLNESQRSVNDRADAWKAENRDRRTMQRQTVAGTTLLYIESRREAQITREHLQEDEATARKIIEHLGPKDVNRLDAFDVEAALKRFASTPRTAKKFRDFGRKLYKWLQKRGWAERNPFADSDAPRYQPETHQEPMRPEDFERAIERVSDPAIKAMLLLLRWSGIRPVNARRLTWPELIDHDGRTFLRLSAAKTRAGKVPIYVPEQAARVVKSLAKTGLLVFPSKVNGQAMSKSHVGRVWAKAQREAGVPHRTVYDLKHLCVTERLEAFGDDALAALSVGIKSADVANTNYRQVDSLKLAKKIERMNR